MKNWLKNLLFVLFSFIFLGVGMVVAEFFIREKGNPLKDPNFLADTPPDTIIITHNIPADSTNGWEADSILATQKPVVEPKKEVFVEESKTKSGDYQVIIGIFGEPSNANREIKKLKSLGYLTAFSFSKRSMDVVCAGLFDKLEAEKVAFDLKNKGFDAIVKHQ